MPGVTAALDNLVDLTVKLQQLPVALTSTAHEVIFAQTRVCIEECWEICLLAANRTGKGASKMIRGLYERAVTIVYISKDQSKAERFYTYSIIQEHRTLAHARKLFSDEVLNAQFGFPLVEEADEAYKEAKKEFQKTKCKTCKTTETAHSWDIDLVSMAGKAGEGLAELYLLAYAIPTLQFHATGTSGLSRTTTDEYTTMFNCTVPEEETDLCSRLAFSLIGLLVDINIKMFQLPLEKELADFSGACEAVPIPSNGGPGEGSDGRGTLYAMQVNT